VGAADVVGAPSSREEKVLLAKLPIDIEDDAGSSKGDDRAAKRHPPIAISRRYEPARLRNSFLAASC
jgi:hypothetical protein